jgi:starch synthase (maltosyl-transferring)
MTHRHIIIENVTPSVDKGDYPAKRVVGDLCNIGAHIYRDCDPILQAVVRWRHKDERLFHETPLTEIENDEWHGAIQFSQSGRYEFKIAAWTNEFATWQEYFRRKVKTDADIRSDLLEGAAIATALLPSQRSLRGHRAESKDALWIMEMIAEMQSPGRSGRATDDLSDVIERALSPTATHFFSLIHPSSDVATSATFTIIVEPLIAGFSAWYEMFPRSAGKDEMRGATFKEAESRLPEIRNMGFDVLYLPPIHPIGTTNRKGRNNALVAAANDPGSPWQVGSAEGGHTAIEPSLGTFADFDHFLIMAKAQGLAVALDFAIQCSPDHPWVKEHPEWFLHRPDGTIKYAENPPKKYQDIYPMNFDTNDEEGLWDALYEVLLFWIGRGILIFRVDNPHTKPSKFWQFIIGKIKQEYPDVIFLAEAFTRPKRMKLLAKVGFSQSYTYFTWRNTKQELISYLTELTQSGMEEYFRPNFFTNTPDILPPILQQGGVPAFKMRLLLAATLSPAYGIYSGYELCENEAIPGTEEYLDSEKYRIKVRDGNRKPNIKSFITLVNKARQENPALQQLTNLTFLETDNEQILAYMKKTADGQDIIIVVVNLDPYKAQSGHVRLPLDFFKKASAIMVHDLLTGVQYKWSEQNAVYLDPQAEPGHLFWVETSQ